MRRGVSPSLPRLCGLPAAAKEKIDGSPDGSQRTTSTGRAPDVERIRIASDVHLRVYFLQGCFKDTLMVAA